MRLVPLVFWFYRIREARELVALVMVMLLRLFVHCWGHSEDGPWHSTQPSKHCNERIVIMVGVLYLSGSFCWGFSASSGVWRDNGSRAHMMQPHQRKELRISVRSIFDDTTLFSSSTSLQKVCNAHQGRHLQTDKDSSSIVCCTPDAHLTDSSRHYSAVKGQFSPIVSNIHHPGIYLLKQHPLSSIEKSRPFSLVVKV